MCENVCKQCIFFARCVGKGVYLYDVDVWGRGGGGAGHHTRGMILLTRMLVGTKYDMINIYSFHGFSGMLACLYWITLRFFLSLPSFKQPGR